jgi:lipopolysaccharide export system protein LptA
MNAQFFFTATALVLAAVTAAHAERADRDRPLNIESDALRYEERTQTSTFTGHVVATKGTIVMRGAQLVVRQEPDGQVSGTLTAAPGERAFFRQKRDGVDEFIEGEAERIEYDGRADRVRFVRRAELRRLRGETLADQVTGEVIVYEHASGQFSVDGVREVPGGGRVRAVIAPRAAASAPTSALPAATSPLRPASALGGAVR